MSKEEKRKEAAQIRNVAKTIGVKTDNLMKTVLKQIFVRIEKLFFQGWTKEALNAFEGLPENTKSMFLLEYCQEKEHRIEIFFFMTESMTLGV